MRRQRRSDVDGSATRMRYRDTPGQQMQLVLHAAGKFVVLDAEILLVADDRMADALHVGAELVGAAGDRLERQPGELLRRGLDHGGIRDGLAGILFAGARDALHALVPALLLGEKRGYPPP